MSELEGLMLKLVHFFLHHKILELVDVDQCQDYGQRHLLLFTFEWRSITTREMEKDHSIKSVESKGASISHSSGGKIP